MMETPGHNGRRETYKEIRSGNNGVAVKLSTFLSGELGVITTQSFQKGDLVFRVKGPITPHRTKYSFQFGKNQHVEPADEDDGKPSFGHYLNHSCEPNVAIRIIIAGNGGYIEVFALSSIEADQEITVDYATMEYETTVDQHPCRCRSPRCRQFIHGYKDLPSEKKAEFRSRGLIPAHLLEQDAENGIRIREADSNG